MKLSVFLEKVSRKKRLAVVENLIFLPLVTRTRHGYSRVSPDPSWCPIVASSPSCVTSQRRSKVNVNCYGYVRRLCVSHTEPSDVSNSSVSRAMNCIQETISMKVAREEYTHCIVIHELHLQDDDAIDDILEMSQAVTWSQGT